jgi:hypothetical protein
VERNRVMDPVLESGSRSRYKIKEKDEKYRKNFLIVKKNYFYNWQVKIVKTTRSMFCQ